MNDISQIVALKSRSVVRVSGPDWRSFLHNLLTNDVDSLAAGEARFAALLTPQGRLLYDLFIVGEDDGALIDIHADWRDAFVQRLLLYRLRAKVRIEALDLPVAADLGLAGDGVADPRLSALGRRLYGVEGGSGEEVYEARRLSLGVPGPGDWGTDRAYPIEADFDLLNGIDFQKGCFVGQETTSRMKRRGAIRNRMLPIDYEGSPIPPGTEVLAGSLRAGEVLSGMAGRSIALLRLDRIEGAELTAGYRAVTAVFPDWMSAPA